MDNLIAPEVVIIGDIMLDVLYNGDATRLAQEACIPIMNVKNENIKYSLGGAANVYNNLNKMNVNAQLISVVGTDKYTHYIDEQLMHCKNAIYNKVFYDNSRCTTTKHRFYVDNKIVFRYDTEDVHDINDCIVTNILDFFKSECAKCKVVILSDYNKGVLTRRLTQEIIKFSNEHNIKVFVDPKKDIEKYAGCFLIKPNKYEGECICCKKISNNNVNECVKEICKSSNSQNCLLTLGKDGMILYDGNNENILSICTTQNDVIDITGAGDVVMASFVYKYIQTDRLDESAKFANYCGQLKVKNFGTYTITPYDILCYEKYNKIIMPCDLNNIIKIIKESNKKIVFTNGCYDILHYGHLTFLEEAKSHGDILIVALNTDESVREN